MWLDLDLWQIRRGNRFNIISYLKETYVQHSHAFQLCIPNCTYSKSPGQLKYSSCRELTLVPLQMVEIIWHLQAKVRLLYKRIKIRVGKWSRVSRETRLKIGLAISRDLKCETCKTQKLAKIMHFGSFWEGNINFSVNSAKECYARHRITWKNLNIPQKNINFSHFF